MSGPDFVGVGTERSGSSWVFSMIAHHPDSWVPPLKELHFLDQIDQGVPSNKFRYKNHLLSRIKHKAVPFLDFSDRPEFFKNSYYEYLRWDLDYFTGKMDLNWYSRLFSQRYTKGRVSGEYTPAYCNISDEYIDMLLTLNPDMKFIIFFRNPLAQMRSSLIQHFVMIKGRDFSSVSESEMIDWLNTPFARFKANYCEIMERWSSRIKKENLFIQNYDRIATQPETLIKELYGFLNLNEDFLPDERFYKRPINKLSKKTDVLPKAVSTLIYERFIDELKSFKKLYPELSNTWTEDNE